MGASALFVQSNPRVRSYCDAGRVETYVISSDMKRVHFLRHAEGYHNIAGKNNPLGYLRADLIDANLSQHGEQQCHDFSTDPNNVNIFQSAELLVVSPMNRTIQTATLCFPSLVNRIPWIAVEDLRETTGIHPCDKRLTKSEHKAAYNHVNFDEVASETDPIYHLYTYTREPDKDVQKRCRAFLQWLQNRPEKEIIVVTHRAYLRQMLRSVLDIEGSNEPSHCIRFANCECRTYIITLPSTRIEMTA